MMVLTNADAEEMAEVWGFSEMNPPLGGLKNRWTRKKSPRAGKPGPQSNELVDF
jgi:hypothetical protein